MSMEECLNFLRSHEGKHTAAEIAEAIGTELSVTRKAMTRLYRRGEVTRQANRIANPTFEYDLPEKEEK